MVNMITRLPDVTAGQIVLDGQDIDKPGGEKNYETFKKMQMVFRVRPIPFDPRRTLEMNRGEPEKCRGCPGGRFQGRSGTTIEQCGLSKNLPTAIRIRSAAGAVPEGGHCQGWAIQPKLLIW